MSDMTEGWKSFNETKRQKKNTKIKNNQRVFWKKKVSLLSRKIMGLI